MGIIYKNGIPYGNQPSTDAVAMIEPSEEASATSAHAYAAGDHFIYNGTLYRATAAIAIGDTITPDTNCVATTVMTEVEAGGGGGGGTSDYTQLSNKPQINGNTLTGNKTGADLGLVNAVTGKQLSTEDYTTAEKTKLAGIEAQANKTVIDDTLTNTGEAADAKAVGDAIGDIEDITGDGQLSGFTATDLTGAANELKNTLNQLESGLAIPQTGNTASRSIPADAFIFLTGNSDQTNLPDGTYQNTSGSAIGNGATFTTSNLTRQTPVDGALNTISVKQSGTITRGQDCTAVYASSLYKKNGVCYFTFVGAVRSVSNTALTVFEIPSGFRPVVKQFFAGAISDASDKNSVCGLVSIDTSGNGVLTTPATVPAVAIINVSGSFIIS